MDEEQLPGAIGTGVSIALRLGQVLFSLASVVLMVISYEFYESYTYTSFRFLVTIKCIMIPWSFVLFLVDLRTSHDCERVLSSSSNYVYHSYWRLGSIIPITSSSMLNSQCG